ncbi:MAG TPA: metallophosphoesterase [Candidatus Omnitrophota bacterium]|nr:metallophosphoesterase [Candidatus Omnitrophota bacterium]MDD5737047.1 metallophosphoesterase [Candidatus Omnitrophota bacterium]HPN65981.1 metallophosphoesterase [Candidatus Omnitrophota bacterium]
MKIGVMSDSHDNVPMVKKAVDAFNAEGCSLVVHAGDFCAPFAVTPLEKLKCKWLGVFGNNDGDKKALSMKSNGMIVDHPYRYDLSNIRMIVTHEIEDVQDLLGMIDRQEVHLLIHGHTHKTDIKTVKTCLIVNPGETGGWTTGRATVAIVDTETMTAKEIELK